jgi:hypothetical protein
MIADSNEWTGADGKAWGYPKEVNRSRGTRWLLLMACLIFLTIIILIFSGIPILGGEKFVPFAIFLVTLALVDRSPFRHKQIAVGKKLPFSAWTLKQPDEVEMALFAEHNVSAHYVSTALILGLFGWIAFASSNAQTMPAQWQDWLTIGAASAAMIYMLPTLIAEWRVPFSPKHDDDDG